VESSIGEENTENFEENMTRKKTKTNDCFSSFFVMLRNSLIAVPKQIQSEGEM
jgi:hypothetical protein